MAMTELDKDAIYRLAILSAFLVSNWDNQTALHEIDYPYGPENSGPDVGSWSHLVAEANTNARWVGVPEINDAYMVAETLFPREYDYLDQLRQVMREAA